MPHTDEKRPDPDALLHRVKAEEKREQRGRLKIFFGASAGVGKTYAMLEAARAASAAGLDIVAGIIETHGRKETEALVNGLEFLPPRFIEYKNTKLREFDLEGAIKRHPAVILVDELAHTNAPGSKNEKRWQDVKELLDAGIHVYTTLNVQHVESLNDIVAQITGVIVRETVPDAVVEEADEIELIDLPPDDLLQRLKDGKVYIADQAQRAAGSFFRKGNLTALRELALRQTADRVNEQIQSYRKEQSIGRTWATREKLLVCVGPSPFSARLVRAARRMASGLRSEWTAATIERPNFSEADRERVKQHLRLAEQLGAETVTLSGENVVDEVVNYARSHNITKIITGKPSRPQWRDRLFGSFVDELIRKSADIDIYVIKGDAENEKREDEFASPVEIGWASYGWGVAMVAVCTLIGHLMFNHFDVSNIIMIYLLGVALVAARFGRGPAIFSSIASVAAFDFFFVKPYFTFAVSDSQYFITFCVMLTVGILISSLTVQIRQYAQSATLREQRTAALYSMSRELSSARGMKNLLEIAIKHIAHVFDARVIGLIPDPDGRLLIEAGNVEASQLTARERSVAQWVFDLGQIAGLGTDTLPGAEGIYVPFNATSGPVGVIGLFPNRAGRAISSDQLHLLQAFTTQAALSIERDRLEMEAQQARLNADAERSRNALLSSISHDLRTPLAAISGAASSLLCNEEVLNRQAKHELLESINDEAGRMSRLVSNLLEMTKLESGAVKVKKELCPLEEVIGSAVSRLEKSLQTHPLRTSLPQDLPLIPMDILLMEQVFINLLENAAKYTPTNSEIEINASADAKEVRLEVADCGPGIVQGQERKLFDKFFRSETHKGVSGAGLGLAICRAIIEAHGGSISAANRTGGGAVFKIILPLQNSTTSPEQSKNGRE